MVLPILKFPDPRLRQESLPVREDMPPEELQRLVADMLDTMYDAGGVGLAAIQVGRPLRLLVLDVGLGPEVYVDPSEPLLGPERARMREGCLSFPGVFGDVERSTSVEFEEVYRAASATGVPPMVNLVAAGVNTSDLPGTPEQRRMRAQCLQHEVEHFEGVLLVDHMSAVAIDRARRRAKRLGRGR